jgi:hypothetical protein
MARRTRGLNKLRRMRRLTNEVAVMRRLKFSKDLDVINGSSAGNQPPRAAGNPCALFFVATRRLVVGQVISTGPMCARLNIILTPKRGRTIECLIYP